MIDFNTELQNNNILLRPLNSNDLEEFLNITKEQSLWKYYAYDLSIHDELKKWIDTALDQMNNKTRLAFTVINKDTGEVIGSSSFGNISSHDKRIEIGWTWLGRDYQGKRINDQMKYLMMKYCFEECDFERVEFKTDVLNVHARKAFERMGIVEEGILRSHSLMTNNRRRDTIYYGTLRSEWDKLKIRNNWD